MKLGDLNDPLYNEQYTIVKKIEKFETIEKCIDLDLKDEGNLYMKEILYSMRKIFHIYPEEYTDIYPVIENIIAKHIPINIMDLILEDIDNEIGKFNLEYTDNLSLFVRNKDIMNIFYNCINHKKHLLFIKDENNTIDEIIVTCELMGNNIVNSLIIENKRYTCGIDYKNPEIGLCYYNDTEKILIIADGDFFVTLTNDKGTYNYYKNN